MSSIVYALPTLKPSWNTTLMQYPTTRITRIYCYAALVLETLVSALNIEHGHPIILVSFTFFFIFLPYRF